MTAGMATYEEQTLKLAKSGPKKVCSALSTKRREV
jgi:hypothetical protein